MVRVLEGEWEGSRAREKFGIASLGEGWSLTRLRHRIHA